MALLILTVSSIAAQGWQERDAARRAEAQAAWAATSRVAGTVARVTAEERDGRLVVTLEVSIN